MTSICAWCRRHLGGSGQPISHGMCDECLRRQLYGWENGKGAERDKDGKVPKSPMQADARRFKSEPNRHFSVSTTTSEIKPSYVDRCVPQRVLQEAEFAGEDHLSRPANQSQCPSGRYHWERDTYPAPRVRVSGDRC